MHFNYVLLNTSHCDALSSVAATLISCILAIRGAFFQSYSELQIKQASKYIFTITSEALQARNKKIPVLVRFSFVNPAS